VEALEISEEISWGFSDEEEAVSEETSEVSDEDAGETAIGVGVAPLACLALKLVRTFTTSTPQF